MPPARQYQGAAARRPLRGFLAGRATRHTRAEALSRRAWPAPPTACRSSRGNRSPVRPRASRRAPRRSAPGRPSRSTRRSRATDPRTPGSRPRGAASRRRPRTRRASRSGADRRGSRRMGRSARRCSSPPRRSRGRPRSGRCVETNPEARAARLRSGTPASRRARPPIRRSRGRRERTRSVRTAWGAGSPRRLARGPRGCGRERRPPPVRCLHRRRAPHCAARGPPVPAPRDGSRGCSRGRRSRTPVDRGSERRPRARPAAFGRRRSRGEAPDRPRGSARSRATWRPGPAYPEAPCRAGSGAPARTPRTSPAHGTVRRTRWRW